MENRYQTLKIRIGVALFIEMANIVRQQGEGFVPYQWPMPGAKDPVD